CAREEFGGGFAYW
nr:immunoglobulin heavy chain junction region [Mus musculus]